MSNLGVAMQTSEIRFLKKKEVADLLNVSVYTIDRYVKKRGLPIHRVTNEPRFRLDKVLKWMDQFEQRN